MNEPKVTRSVELPQALNDATKARARRETTSVASIIRKALIQYLGWKP